MVLTEDARYGKFIFYCNGLFYILCAFYDILMMDLMFMNYIVFRTHCCRQDSDKGIRPRKLRPDLSREITFSLTWRNRPKNIQTEMILFPILARKEARSDLNLEPWALLELLEKLTFFTLSLVCNLSTKKSNSVYTVHHRRDYFYPDSYKHCHYTVISSFAFDIL